MGTCAKCGGTHLGDSPCLRQMAAVASDATVDLGKRGPASSRTPPPLLTPSAAPPPVPPPADATEHDEPAADLPAGTVVGEYQITHKIGAGGMGAVYAAVQPLIDKKVAIKVLNAEFSADGRMVRRFMQEARASNRVEHPNIIDVFSLGQLPDGRYYCVMELLPGESLGHLLHRRRLTAAEAQRFLDQTTDALAAAHTESIIHRDLKPDNIFIVEPRRGDSSVKVLDFGIAKLLGPGPSGSQPDQTRAGTPIGTPHYMSPEQARGDTTIDHRTDIYALGVIMFEIFTGRRPFQGASNVEILHSQIATLPPGPSALAQVPPRLEQLILRCLAKAAADRPQSMQDVGVELGAIFTDEGAAIEALLQPNASWLAGGAAADAAAGPPAGGGARSSAGPR
ncbi:MAG TPA: serine/threonine-protein kinase, partial [Polyangia bacterium]